MTELKPLTYDEHKATEAAFRGCAADPEWTEAAQLLYEKLSAAIEQRAGATASPMAESLRMSVGR